MQDQPTTIEHRLTTVEVSLKNTVEDLDDIKADVRAIRDAIVAEARLLELAVDVGGEHERAVLLPRGPALVPRLPGVVPARTRIACGVWTTGLPHGSVGCSARPTIRSSSTSVTAPRR